MIRKPAFILLLLLAGMVPPLPAEAGAAGAGAAGAPSTSFPPTPVLLIHGLASHPGIWLQGEEHSFVRALQRAGYRTGRDIHFLDFSDAAGEDPYQVAAERLVPLVQAILRGTGAERIDLVGHSMGGVVGRYYVEQLGGDRFVRTLAMVGSPLHGSFAAGIVVKSGQVVEALSSLPADLTEGLEGRIREAGQERKRAAGQGPQWEWRGPVDWARLLGEQFLPLYLRYLSRGLLAPATPAPGLGEGFEGWWKREDPASFRAAFFSPQAAAVPAEGGCRGEGLCAEELLSRASFHQAAVEASRAFLIASGDRAGVAKAPAGPVDLMRSFLPGSGTAAGHLQAAAVSKAWLGLEPDAPALLRLVEEERLLRAESPSLGYIPVHRKLAEWNAGSEARAQERPVRYLMAAGKAWNLWSVLFAGVPPNDGAVETASAFLRPGALDASLILPGRVTHLGLLQQEDLQRWLVPRLDPFWGEQELPVRGMPGDAWRLPLERNGREPSVWLPPDRSPGGEFRWSGGSPAGPAGWLCPSGRMTPGRPEGALLSGREGSLVDPGPDCRLFIRDGAADPVGMLQRPSGEKQVYRLTWVADAHRTGTVQATAGSTETVHATAGASEKEAAPGPARPPLSRQWAAPSLPPSREEQEIPLLEATYRSRMTSLKEERRTTQSAWRVSFGDGTTSLVPVQGGQRTASIRHRYGQAGRYRVEAVAVANDGRELWRDTWEVETEGESMESWELPVLFEPVPELRLIGPRSWVTGLPAEYTVQAVLPSGPHIREISISYDPAEHFRMLWHRPGDFRVRAAATVRIRYEMGDESSFTLSNTYVVEVPVEVLATTLLRSGGS